MYVAPLCTSYVVYYFLPEIYFPHRQLGDCLVSTDFRFPREIACKQEQHDASTQTVFALGLPDRNIGRLREQMSSTSWFWWNIELRRWIRQLIRHHRYRGLDIRYAPVTPHATPSHLNWFQNTVLFSLLVTSMPCSLTDRVKDPLGVIVSQGQHHE